MIAVFGGQRRAVLARELTKLYETIIGDHLAGLCARVDKDTDQQKGEIVVLVHGAEAASIDMTGLRAILEPLQAELPLKQAVSLATKISGLNRNTVYELALQLKAEDDEP